MIPVCVPLLGEKELEYVADCIKTNWISSKGKYVEEFEDRFARYCGCKYGITTTSGTTALHLALASISADKGDEVIIPAFTMIATAFAVVYCGAKPVLVDSEPETWNMNVDQMEEKITKRTKAIIPVHIYGHPCDMDPIMEIAEEYGLYVIEDAAEAHGAEYRDKKTGGIGNIGCFSFYANKIITTGEGGMIVTNDEKIAERAKYLRNLCFPKERRIYLHSEVGYNYRMTNVQAAIGLAQLERIDELVEMRRKNAYLYNKFLKDIEGIRLPLEKEWAKNVYWMYSIVLEESFPLSRDEVVVALRENGIDSRPFFHSIDTLPPYRSQNPAPNSLSLSQCGLNLPSSPCLTDSQVRHICDTISMLAA